MPILLLFSLRIPQDAADHSIGVVPVGHEATGRAWRPARPGAGMPGQPCRGYLMVSLCNEPMLPRTKTLNARHQRSSSERFGSTECDTTDGNRQMSFVFGE